jgi:hypothetical protein
MIEDPFLPLFSTMTLSAYPAIAPVVRIVDQMASNTLVWRVLVVIIGMTQRTDQFPVLASQRVLRIQVMIKALRTPALFVVAGITLLTQLSIVGIIGFMTIEA